MNDLRQTQEKFDVLVSESSRSNLESIIKKWLRKRASVEMPVKRKSLTPGQKKNLYMKQSGKCARCKEPMDFHDASDDHLIAISQGGTNELRNRRLVHGKCNSSKGGNSLITESKLGHGTILDQITK